MPAAQAPSTPLQALRGLTVLERGWLSSNNVVVHPAAGEGGAVLVDSSHVLHAQQTVALLHRCLQGQPLLEIVNTHLHSDHCGGNAAVQDAFGCRIRIPPGQFEAAVAWDAAALSYAATGQQCDRFKPQATISPGQCFVAGGRRWDALAAPGHDPHAVMLFDARHGVLISADALWENGFGIIFPELQGDSGFAEATQVLDLIESLDAQVVIPGHGRPFTDVGAALQRARSRLARFVAAPARHRWHAAKVLIKYHMMEQRQQSLPNLLVWLHSAPLLSSLSGAMQTDDTQALQDYCQRALDELCAAGVLRVQEGMVFDA